MQQTTSNCTRQRNLAFIRNTRAPVYGCACAPRTLTARHVRCRTPHTSYCVLHCIFVLLQISHLELRLIIFWILSVAKRYFYYWKLLEECGFWICVCTSGEWSVMFIRSTLKWIDFVTYSLQFRSFRLPPKSTASKYFVFFCARTNRNAFDLNVSEHIVDIIRIC